MTLSICFLGAGKITAQHIKIIKKMYPNLRLGIASRTLSAAKIYQRKYKLASAFGDYKEAINSDFDVIVIATPPAYHLQSIEACLQANKKIIVEKPIVNSWEELVYLHENYAGQLENILIAENLHFDPFHKKIKNLMQTHDFGRPLYMDLTRFGYNKNQGWRKNSGEMPLGAMHEGGVHWLRRLNDYANIFNTSSGHGINSVRATCPPKPLTDTPNEDTMQITIYHTSGLVSRLNHSWGIPRRSGFLDFSKIIFEKGAVYFDEIGLIGFQFGPRGWKILAPCITDFGGYKNMWKHYIFCLQNSVTPELTFTHITDDFKLLEATYRSAQQQKEVKLLDL